METVPFVKGKPDIQTYIIYLIYIKYEKIFSANSGIPNYYILHNKFNDINEAVTLCRLNSVHDFVLIHTIF